MQNKISLYIKVFSQFLFYLIGTFLHEAAHWIAAKLTLSETPAIAVIEEEDINGNKFKKTVSGFTIIPRIKKDYVVYGHVFSIPRINASLVLISAAPLVWFIALYYLLLNCGFIFITIENGKIFLNFNYKEFFTPQNLLIIYISLQLIWAGTLSSQDIKMFFKGVLSVSFIIIFLATITIYDFFNNYQIFHLLQRVLS
ncbi:MAG: hypothetical protein WC656_01665 [Sulfurimonas sp.]